MPTFGNTFTQPGYSSPNASNRAVLTSFVAPTSGHIDTIRVSFDVAPSVGDSFKFIVFSDNNGSPDTLLFSTSEIAIPQGGGWVTSVLSGNIVGGTSYWLGIVSNSSAGDSRIGVAYAGDTSVLNNSFSFTSPPTTWPGSDSVYNTSNNIEITYTETVYVPPNLDFKGTSLLTIALGFNPSF